MLCAGTGCVSNNSLKIKDILEKEITKHNLQDEVSVVLTGCNGFCANGPIMVVKPEGVFYQLLSDEDIPGLVEEHFLKGRPVKKLFYVEPASEETIPSMNEIPFFKHQMFWAMRNKGAIDPEVIAEYIARDGYFGAAKALQEMSPEQIIGEVKASG